MSADAQKRVFVVDDEVKVLKAITESLGGLSVEVMAFVSPVECLQHLRNEKCDLLIADLRMPEMDGMELLANVKHHTPWIPVLVVTGFGDVSSAVQAIKAGAADFIEKPLDRSTLLRTVESILRDSDMAGTSVGKPLTQIQQTVLKLIVDGRSNREIADMLNRSVRTIEVHRSHVMEKLGVGNLIDLVKRAASLGMVDLASGQESQEYEHS